MRLGLASITVILGACFDPSPQLDLQCSPGGSCPSGQRCDPVTNECIAAGDEDGIVIQFEAAGSSVAEGDTIDIAVTLSRPADTEITGVVALSGTASGFDFMISRTDVLFAPGESTQILTLDAIDEATDEGDELLVLGLSSVEGAVVGVRAVHDLTIADAGGVILRFASATSTASEADGPHEITVELSRPAPGDVTFSLIDEGGSAGGSDYAVASTDFTIAAGDISIIITAAITDDSLDENSESFDLELLGVSGPATVSTIDHTTTITDNDPQPTVTFSMVQADGSALEGTAITVVYTYTVTLSTVSGRTVTVPVAVTGSANALDYTITSGDIPVSFSAGTTSRSIRVNVIGDATIEANEVVTMTLQPPTNADLGAIAVRNHTIVNDD